MSDQTRFRFQAALDLCETLLMPGGKARLSPYLQTLIPPGERFLVPIYQSVVLDLLRSGHLPGDLVLFDLNSPAGLGTLAALEALLAWQTACMVYGVESGLHNVSVQTLTDRQPLRAFADMLGERFAWLPALTALEQVRSWAAQASAPTAQPPNLALLTLPWPTNPKIDLLLDRLPPGAIVAAITWQGLAERPEQVFDWRYRLLRERQDYVALGPCGQEYGRVLPAACQTCAHGRRITLHISTGDTIEPPAWSYVLLSKRATPVEQPAHQLIAVTDFSQVEVKDLHVRYLGSIREKEVVAAHPDTFNDNPADDKWHEYLRLCPGHTGLTKLAIKGNAGMPLPRLRYGQWLCLQGARPNKPYPQAPDVGILRLPNEATLHTIPGRPVEETFLPAYTPSARAAVDEAAFRLFGFASLWPFQHVVLERVLCGDDIFAIAATGGGKSECYILPAMLLPGITVVVSPLKSLMQDQYEQRIQDRYGLDYLTTFINGDIKFYERQGRLRRMALGHFKLAYVTPEQLERGYVLDALRQAAQAVGVRYLALDEAHCISQWGHDFRPSYLNIVERLRDYGLHPRRIALTATASPLVRDDVCQELKLDRRTLREGGHVFIDSANRPELNLVVHRVDSSEEKARIIVEALRKQLTGAADGSAIVFMPHTGGPPDKPHDFGAPHSAPKLENAGMVSSGVSPFAAYLEKQLGCSVARYHGAMDDSREGGDSVSPDDESDESPTRSSEQRLFMEGKKRVMVATKGFGMGIDKPDIRLVIHRTPTANLEAYAQEAGRAGRDGKLATVMLLFSQDRPQIAPVAQDQFLFRDTLQSDQEIQTFFIEQQYVRRQDVEAMVAFLRSDVPQRINDALYFTNDQVMNTLDEAGKRPAVLELSQPYQWPDFTPRRSWSYESDDHRHIRDRGHLYKARRDHIGRILKVLYNNRPTLNGEIVPLIQAAHETGTVLRDFHLHAPERIIDSPAYFGERLRNAGLDARELRSLLPNGTLVDLTRLAVRLGLSLRETASMLYDIRSCEGRTGQYGKWIGTLLNYKQIEAPRWVKMPDPYHTARWRDYAGAYTRAQAGENRTLDGYFPEWTLNRPVGWEITPGPGLNEPDRLAYLDAFMTLHDERCSNDRANFAYLVERYIGVDDSAPICLRALLLGYLKTGESIVGGNCLGCSVCVPDLNFEQYPVEQRKGVIARLMVETLDLIETVEQSSRQPLLLETGHQLLQAIAQENAQGRSGTAYLESWLTRLIQDDPEHQGALWLRLYSFEGRVLDPSTQELGAAIERLVRLTTLPEHLKYLSTLVERCLGDPAFHSLKRLLIVQSAELAGRQELWPQEADGWAKAIVMLDPVRFDQTDAIWLRRALTRLLALHRPDGPVPDQERLGETALALMRLPGSSFETVQDACRAVAHGWRWQRAIETLSDASIQHPAAVLLAWLETASPAARKKVFKWLEDNNERWAGWPVTVWQSIDAQHTTLLDQFPQLLLAIVDASGGDAPLDSAMYLVRAWASGALLSTEHCNHLARRLTEVEAGWFREKAEKQTARARALLAELWVAQGRGNLPLSWLDYFPLQAVNELPDEVLAGQRPFVAQAAQSAHHHRQWPLATALWQRVIDLAQPDPPEPALQRQALAGLLAVYDRDGPLPDESKAAEIGLRLARLPDQSFETAEAAYAPVARRWAWAQVEAELLAGQGAHPYAALTAWLSTALVDGRLAALTWLNDHRTAWASWPIESLRAVDVQMGDILDQLPDLLMAVAEQLCYEPEEEVAGAQYLVRAWAGGAQLSVEQLSHVAQHLTRLDAGWCKEQLSRHEHIFQLWDQLVETRGQEGIPLSWLRYFPLDVVRSLPDDALINLLQVSGSSPEMLDADMLAVIAQRATQPSGDILRQETIQQVARQAGLAARLVNACLDASSERSEMLEPLFAALLRDRSDDQATISILDRLSADQTLREKEGLLAVCLDTWSALQTDKAWWSALYKWRIEGSTLVELTERWMTFASQIHRLDMLVIILDDVRKRSISSWMTPVSLQFQALCAAGRFAEAARILQSHPTISIKRQSAASYLASVRKQTIERRGVYTPELERLWQLVSRTMLSK